MAPKRVSFLAFCVSNVLIDLEPLYFMLTQRFPLHRFFHTYVGATLVAMATVVLFVVARRLAPSLSLPNIFHWQDLRVMPVGVGAMIGVYSHIALDSLMHADIRPLAPFSDANPLLHAVSLGALHASCVAAGAVGIGVLWIRRQLRFRRCESARRLAALGGSEPSLNCVPRRRDPPAT